MHQAPLFISLADTDAAGVIYFASLLRLGHTLLEQFFAKQGIDLLQCDGVIFPVVHCEADYKKPNRYGDQLTCSISCVEQRHTNFTVVYSFAKQDGLVTATARTIHAAVNRERFVSCGLPQRMIDALGPLHIAAT
jgi:1,4-dihydroxy-2-naphthoyl-CoA hydrolase